MNKVQYKAISTGTGGSLEEELNKAAEEGWILDSFQCKDPILYAIMRKGF